MTTMQRATQQCIARLQETGLYHDTALRAWFRPIPNADQSRHPFVVTDKWVYYQSCKLSEALMVRQGRK